MVNGEGKVVNRVSRAPYSVQSLGKRRRRRWSPEERAAVVRETYTPGMTVSLVARLHGIAPSQLFRWRRLYSEASVDEEVMPASQTRLLQQQVQELQRLLGKQALENEILRQALERAQKKR
jgi:transposase